MPLVSLAIKPIGLNGVEQKGWPLEGSLHLISGEDQVKRVPESVLYDERQVEKF